MKRALVAMLAVLTASAPLAATAATPWHETKVEVGNAPYRLGATLTMPDGKGPSPAVVLVSGSGPNDRDETIGPNKPFLDIAHGLAAHGIAVLRYDKRTKTYPQAFIGKPFTIDDEYTGDAISAVKVLQATNGVDPKRVFVLGHSQGAQMAPRIAQRDPSIAGLILIGAPAQPLLAAMHRQLEYLAGIDQQHAAQLRQQAAMVEAARTQLAHLDPKHPDAPGPLGLPTSYWLSLREYNAIAVAKTLKQPMLILQGGRDYQVTPRDDFSHWQAAFSQTPRVTLKEYPMLSHLMMPAGNPPSPSDYAKPGHVDPQVIDDIATWIEAQKPRP